MIERNRMGQTKKIPMRQCVGCREMRNKKELVRIIKTKENEFFVDVTGKKNGRGAYICNSMDCFKQAKKSKALERTFKTAIPDEIYDALEKELGGADE
jgi:predicted RNA-binding protein YlxR (DUF448 family)